MASSRTGLGENVNEDIILSFNLWSHKTRSTKQQTSATTTYFQLVEDAACHARPRPLILWASEKPSLIILSVCYIGRFWKILVDFCWFASWWVIRSNFPPKPSVSTSSPLMHIWSGGWQDNRVCIFKILWHKTNYVYVMLFFIKENSTCSQKSKDKAVYLELRSIGDTKWYIDMLL